jgi:hypothetical protein
MSNQNHIASYKGQLKESRVLKFELYGQAKLMEPEVGERPLMLPTQFNQTVFICIVTTNVDTHITDTICRLDDDNSAVVKRITSTPDRPLLDGIFVDIEGQGIFELNRNRLHANLERLLQANTKVRLRFKKSDRNFSILSFEPLIPDTLKGIFFYDEQRHKSGGKKVVLGAFTSACGKYENLPCKMMLATLTESSVFSHLTEGFRLEVTVKLEFDEIGESLIVTELALSTYPDMFEAEITSATLIEKDKPTENQLVCEFSYFQGLVSRVYITNKKLDVVAVEEVVSFKANLSFNPTDKFKFTFLWLAMTSPFDASVIPKELEPYPCEFEFSCFGLVIKVSVKRDSWEKFEKSKEQVSFSGVSVPAFELDKACTLPVTYWQANKDATEHSAWSPIVMFYLNRLSLPEVIKGTLSYVTSEYRSGHLYYLFRRGDVDMHYPILAAEFFLYGIGGFNKGASIDLRIEKYSRYNSETKKGYKAKHPRGSKRNEWSVQEVMSTLPILSPNASNSLQEAYIVMEWCADIELMRLSNEYWVSFSTQRQNFAYCALTGHGDLYPLVAIPPILLRKSDYFRLESNQQIKLQVGSESVTSKDGLPQWCWAKSVASKQPSEESKPPEVKQLTCIERKEVEPSNNDGSKGKKYLQLTFHDSGGTEYIYSSFKLGTYPLEDSDLDKYEHLALCIGKDRVVEIIEMVRKNEA